MKTKLIEPNQLSWSAEIDTIRALLGAPNNHFLFPPHFLKSVFPKLGCKLVVFINDTEYGGVGFLFPRNHQPDKREFTLRYHKIDPQFHLEPISLQSECEKIIPGSHVYVYVPENEQHYQKTTRIMGGFDMGKPGKFEAEKIRLLQQKIWGYHASEDQDFLYPVDIHSHDFRLGTSLVARNKGDIIGFLFGFFTFDDSPGNRIFDKRFNTTFRIESQLLGVLPKFRGKGLGALLKMNQAKMALEQGIDLINWTVDPLQFRNAVLNFCQLQATSFTFYPDYYSFRNELNRVPSSRLGITWIIGSNRVQRQMDHPSEINMETLHDHDKIHIVNQGYEHVDYHITADRIAIEIPEKWTRLQNLHVARAKRWRQVTDSIFNRYLGCQEGQYMITGVGERAPKKYLLAERISEKLIKDIIT